MFTGAHFIFYSKDPEADRAFLRDVLGFRYVDVGHGWLIFKSPTAELAVHPASENLAQDEAGHPMAAPVFYLMCEDLRATMKSLEAKNVRCTEVGEERWGIRTTIPLPSGMELGLYQPKHATALNL
jgi:catechol 2,3-dioxygenase-like lactoylglutathione lyase family enzyme